MTGRKIELDLKKDALKDKKATYRLLQAFRRLSEIGDRDEEEKEKLEDLKVKVWSLKKDIAGEEDPHPFISNPEEVEEGLEAARE